MNKTLSTRFHH